MSPVFRSIAAAVLAAALAACAAARAPGRADEYLEGAVITSRVRMALLRDGAVPSSLAIRVQTRENGQVELSGFVGSDVERRRAEEIARGVEGVASVANGIQVR